MKTRIPRRAGLLAVTAMIALPVWSAPPALADSCSAKGLGPVRDGAVVRGGAEFRCDAQPHTGSATLYRAGEPVAHGACQTSAGKSCVAAPSAPFQPGEWCVDWALADGSITGGGCRTVD